MTLRQLLLAATTLTLSLAASSADIRINEVHANPPGSDVTGTTGAEFIELISTGGGPESTDGLWLVLLDADGGNMGRVDGAWDLADLSTGSNGLLLLGLDFVATGGGPWRARIQSGTAIGDIAIPPDKDGLIEPNRAWAVLLVRNFSGRVGVTDVSSNDTTINALNGTLVDAVGLNEFRSDVDPARVPSPIGDLSQNFYSPGNVSRKSGELTANNAASWFGGEVAGQSSDSVNFDVSRRFGGVPEPYITPGAPNVAPSGADLLINEVSLNPPNRDANYEYIELIKVGGEAQSAEGYHLLIVNTDNASDATCGDSRSLGVLVEAWNLDEVTVGANGLALLGQGYDDGEAPWADHADPATTLFDLGSSDEPDSMRLGNNDIGNEILTRSDGVCESDRSNDGFSLLLVRGFSGSPLQDLDSDDDGTLDVTPWTDLVDSVGFGRLALAGDVNETATYAIADVSQAGGGPASFQPDNISRKTGNSSANDASAFYGGKYEGQSPFSIGFVDRIFGSFRGHATPGRQNLADTPPPAALLINEVNLNPPDEAMEFFELRSVEGGIVSAQGLSLVVAATDSGNRGQIERVFDLSPYSTGPNGLLLAGDDFDLLAEVLFSGGVIRSSTAVEDEPDGLPRSFQAGDLPNGPFALLLTAGLAEGPGFDLDANDDGQVDSDLDFEIVDGFSFGRLEHPRIADLTVEDFVPDNVSRYPFSSQSGSSGAWYGGEIVRSSGQTLAFDSSQAFGRIVGAVTPGQANYAAPFGEGRILINEVHANPPGPDGDFEFVELLSASLAAEQLNGLTLVLIDTNAGVDGSGNVGSISNVWSLDGLATGSNGLLLLGDGYDQAPQGGPYSGVKDPSTSVGDPAGMNGGDLGANEGFALLLVRDFAGFPGQDLDAGNDNVLDERPWAELVDAVAFGAKVFGFPNMNQAGYTPDSFSRGGSLANLITASTDHWYGGSLEGDSGTSTVFTPSQRFDRTGNVPTGRATPGRHNLGGFLDDLADGDRDGVPAIVERALMMDPAAPDADRLPTVSVVRDGGRDYLALTFTHRKGGNGVAGIDYTAAGIHYAAEVSQDLTDWNSGPSVFDLMSVEDSGDGVSEIVVVRLQEAINAADQKFLRLKISRSSS